VLTQQPVQLSSLLCCELSIADVPVAIPTLLQVRWTKKQNLEGARYLSGFQFPLLMPM
jgi:hypothetical protein